jgi:hypothetical protein
LLWKYRKRQTSGSGGLAQEGVACQRIAEEGATNYQRLPGTV